MVTSTIKRIFGYLSQINTTLPPVTQLIGAGLDLFFRITNKGEQSFLFKRFFKANQVLFQKYKSEGCISSPVEILFVSTYKDFPILPHAVISALNVTSMFTNLSVTIITPDRYVAELEDLMKDQIVKVEKESTYFDEEVLNLLERNFYTRHGWVLQQLLKLKYVMDSQAAGVLLVDSDTLLLEERNWLNNDGSQLLTPTWEYHRPYYEFLDLLGVSQLEPEFTFVSHHMMMQPKIVVELFHHLGWKDTSDLVGLICSLPTNGDQSPFSLDYELYAQYLYNKHPDKVVLGKWSNKSITRNASFDNTDSLIETAVLDYSGRFASLSFHSYLTTKAP